MNFRQRRQLKVGYTPLSDCAPLVLAHELGFFQEQGLDVRLERQNSWATSRDLLRIGALDAAHMLAPAVVASWMGDGRRDLVAPLALNLNGNTIALSEDLFEAISAIDPASGDDPAAAAQALARLAPARRAAGAGPLRLAAVFAHSNHHLDLRRWLTAGGLDVERDVGIVIVPPGEVETFLERRLIDGFCVGEPWGSLAVSRGAGRIVATSCELAPNRIEKVLAVAAAFAETCPDELEALVRAVLCAAVWADRPENRAAVASLLVQGGYVDAPVDVVRCGLLGKIPVDARGAFRDQPEFVVFHRHWANFPWLDQAEAFASALAAAGLCSEGGTPRAAFRPDIFRRAATAIAIASPAGDDRSSPPARQGAY